MARTGRPVPPLVLAEEERRVLQQWARRAKTSQALALRSKIVLACAEGAANKDVAARMGVTPQMVGKWRARFVAGRLEGLGDEPRPGQPRKITDEQVEEVIVKTLEREPPDQDTHWSTRSMAGATGLNQTAVSRIWRAFGLRPHLQETWKLSTDPQFIDKVRDVAGLYLNPPEHAMVLCVDEKTQIQAIDRTAPCLSCPPPRPGAATITSATARPACSPRSTSPPARSSPPTMGAGSTRRNANVSGREAASYRDHPTDGRRDPR
jgi:transposase